MQGTIADQTGQFYEGFLKIAGIKAERSLGQGLNVALPPRHESNCSGGLVEHAKKRLIFIANLPTKGVMTCL
jgi:hypothetical protein